MVYLMLKTEALVQVSGFMWETKQNLFGSFDPTSDFVFLKWNKVFLGYFYPIFFLIIKIVTFWGNLSDIFINIG